MAIRDETRLIAKVARLYYEADINQPEIGRRLGISQAKVSRLLRQAIDRDIVRITVRSPVGVHTALEAAIETKFGIAEAIVVDATSDDESQVMRDIGRAAAFLLETTLQPGDVIGISSWSDTLLATVDSMHPVASGRDNRVVQILGGVGSPAAELHATELTRRLAELLKGQPVLLPVPGVVGSAQARQVLEADAHVRQALDLFPQVSVALVGIGTVEPSPLLARSGNVFDESELQRVKDAGGVGDICLRFFDENGNAVQNQLDQRVIGMTLDTLRKVPRSIAVAGGARKTRAIASALRGGLVTHLVTDHITATKLLKQ